MDAEDEAISKASIPSRDDAPGSDGTAADTAGPGVPADASDHPIATATDVALEQDA